MGKKRLRSEGKIPRANGWGESPGLSMMLHVPTQQLRSATLPGTSCWMCEHMTFSYSNYVYLSLSGSLPVILRNRRLELGQTELAFIIEQRLTQKNLNTASLFSSYPTEQRAATPLARILSSCWFNWAQMSSSALPQFFDWQWFSSEAGLQHVTASLTLLWAVALHLSV